MSDTIWIHGFSIKSLDQKTGELWLLGQPIAFVNSYNSRKNFTLSAHFYHVKIKEKKKRTKM